MENCEPEVVMRKLILGTLVALLSVASSSAAYGQVVNVEPIPGGNLQVVTPTHVYVAVPDASGNYKIVAPETPPVFKSAPPPTTTITPNGLIVTPVSSDGSIIRLRHVAGASTATYTGENPVYPTVLPQYINYREWRAQFEFPYCGRIASAARYLTCP